MLEVLVTVTILSTGIVFILRSFSAAITAEKLSQDIAIGCYLAEEKLWEITQVQNTNYASGNMQEGAEIIAGREFGWDYELKDVADYLLSELDLKITLPTRAGQNDYELKFSTYLAQANK